MTFRFTGIRSGGRDMKAARYAALTAASLVLVACDAANEIANIYVQQNVEHKSAESQKTLAFLEKQLPILTSGTLRRKLPAASA